MSLALDENQAKYQIKAYQPGQIQVNDMILTASLIISAHELQQNWPPQHIDELTREHLLPILQLKPAILLIGTGAALQFPEVEIYGELLNHGIGVEIMNTSAACRTYNILTAEGRNVAAALIIS